MVVARRVCIVWKLTHLQRHFSSGCAAADEVGVAVFQYYCAGDVCPMKAMRKSRRRTLLPRLAVQ
jgi:hypothetical protein